MSKWRLAESLKVLREQINAAFPNRSKASDGSIGDARHQKSGSASDHNPWVKDSRGVGVVTAIDITHDPANGVDCHKLAASLTAAGDPRIKYVIWNGRITQKTNPSAWKPYTGKNKHGHHLHISVKSDAASYDSTAPWKLKSAALSIPKKSDAAALDEFIAKAKKLGVTLTGEDIKVATASSGEAGTAQGEGRDVAGSATLEPESAPAPQTSEVSAVKPEHVDTIEAEADRANRESMERFEAGASEPEAAKDDTIKIPAIPPLPVKLPAAAKAVFGFLMTTGVSASSVAAFARDPQLVSAAVTIAKWGFISFAQVATVVIVALVAQKMWNAKLANDLNITRLRNRSDENTPNVDFKGWKGTTDMEGA